MFTSSVLLLIWMFSGVKADESSEEMGNHQQAYVLEPTTDKQSVKINSPTESILRLAQMEANINDDSDEVSYRKNGQYNNYLKNAVDKTFPSAIDGGQSQTDKSPKHLNIDKNEQNHSARPIKNTETRSQGGMSVDQFTLKDTFAEDNPKLKLARKDNTRNKKLAITRVHNDKALSPYKKKTLDITTQNPSKSGVNTDSTKSITTNQNRKGNMLSTIVRDATEHSTHRHRLISREQMPLLKSDSQTDKNKSQNSVMITNHRKGYPMKYFQETNSSASEISRNSNSGDMMHDSSFKHKIRLAFTDLPSNGSKLLQTQAKSDSGISNLYQKKDPNTFSFIKLLLKVGNETLELNKLNKRIVLNDKLGGKTNSGRINPTAWQSRGGSNNTEDSLTFHSANTQPKVTSTKLEVNDKSEQDNTMVTNYTPNKQIEKTTSIDKVSKVVTTGGETDILGKVLSYKQFKMDPSLDYQDTRRAINVFHTKPSSFDVGTKLSNNRNKTRHSNTKNGVNNKSDIVESKFQLRLNLSKIKWTSEPFLDIVRNYTSPRTHQIAIFPRSNQNKENIYNANVNKNEMYNQNDIRDKIRNSSLYKTKEDYIGKDQISSKNASQFRLLQPEMSKSHEIVLPIYNSRRYFSFFNPSKEERLTLGNKRRILPKLTFRKIQIKKPPPIRKNDIRINDSSKYEIPPKITESLRFPSNLETDNLNVKVNKTDNFGLKASDKYRNVLILDSKVKLSDHIRSEHSKRSNNTTEKEHLIKSPSIPKNFLKRDWTIQTTKSSYVIAVPSMTKRKMSNHVDLKSDLDENTSIPQSLSKLHERLQSAWRKRKRTYVSETGKGHDDINIERVSLDVKLVAKTNKSIITIDIPDANVKLLHSGVEYKPGQKTVIQKEVAHKKSSNTFELNKKQSLNRKPFVSVTETTRKYDENFKNISENVKNKIYKDNRYRLPTILPYLISTKTKNMKAKNVENVLQEITKPLKKVEMNGTSESSRTQFAVRNETKYMFASKSKKDEMSTLIPFIVKSNKIPISNEKHDGEIVRDTVTNNLNAMMFSRPGRSSSRPAINMNKKLETINQVKRSIGLFNPIRINSKSPPGFNSVFTIPSSHTRFRDTRPFTSNSELISPTQLQQIQRAMNAIRSRRPNRLPVVRSRHGNRNRNRSFFRQIPRSVRTPFSNNQRVPNNFVQNPSSRLHSQMGWRRSNRNIGRQLHRINTRTPAAGRNFDRNPRFAQQRNIRTRSPI